MITIIRAVRVYGPGLLVVLAAFSLHILKARFFR